MVFFFQMGDSNMDFEDSRAIMTEGIVKYVLEKSELVRAEVGDLI